MSRDLNSWLLPQNSSGYVVGFRGWYFFPGKDLLQSLCKDTHWPIGLPFECEVPLLQERGGKYTDIKTGFNGYDKRVGVFAFKTITQTLNSGFLQHFVGKVALWGEIAEHEGGYRAQYAYPLTLIEGGRGRNSHKKGSEVAKLYGCKYSGETL